MRGNKRVPTTLFTILVRSIVDFNHARSQHNRLITQMASVRRAIRSQ
jgi:hypothetical protein